MDALEKLLRQFERIAPHLRDERVLIGLVFFLFVVSHAALAAEQILVFVLALIVIVGLFGMLFLKLRQGQHTGSTFENSAGEIRMARKLAEWAENFQDEYPKGSKRLRIEARRILFFAGKPDLAASIQREMDEAEPPPRALDPPE